MKYIKTYENIQAPRTYEELNIGKPEIGDYVIIKPYTNPRELSDWIMNTMGKIIDIDDDLYVIKYDNIPKGWEGHFTYSGDDGYYVEGIRKAYKFAILHWSKDKNEIEVIINANKYNL